MKLIHLSDLHLGKRVHGFSMLEDQKYILKQILQIICAEKPDGVLLAGDLYDKAIPPAEAVELLDDFLVALAKENLQTFLISGNHDSPERLAFGGRLMTASGIHVSPVYHGQVQLISLTDDYGTVDLYLLPFIKPAHVRRYFPEEEITSYTDAMAAAIGEFPLVPEHRNVLVTHQFVTGALPSDSEEISVGGTDHVDGDVFHDFDYVALGHIHGPQNIGSPRIRYCGTPLKYSFSEAKHQKSVTVVELKEKGQLEIRTIPLKPLHDLVEIRGSYEEITRRSFYENTAWQTDYIHITLTDEEDIPDAVGKLRSIYHNLMKLDYDNKRTQSQVEIQANEWVKRKTPLQLFSEFYQMQNNQPMSEEQAEFVEKWIKQVWEGEQ
jgi:exonuclease SbcD